SSGVHRFHSRPDLRPPAASVSGSGAGSRYLFISPASTHASQAGPLIVDGSGEPVYFKRLAHGLYATNFGVQEYRGRPALVWWEGKLVLHGYGRGEAVIVDGSYRELRRVRAGNGHQIDDHGFAPPIP